MELRRQNINHKTFTLSQDEPILGSIRNERQVSFQAGDQLLVEVTNTPMPGTLIAVKVNNQIRLCRFEKIHGNDYIFPPIDVDPSKYSQVIIGQLIDHVRL